MARQRAGRERAAACERQVDQHLVGGVHIETRSGSHVITQLRAHRRAQRFRPYAALRDASGAEKRVLRLRPGYDRATTPDRLLGCEPLVWPVLGCELPVPKLPV